MSKSVVEYRHHTNKRSAQSWQTFVTQIKRTQRFYFAE